MLSLPSMPNIASAKGAVSETDYVAAPEDLDFSSADVDFSRTDIDFSMTEDP